jgi:hypothetical protein
VLKLPASRKVHYVAPWSIASRNDTHVALTPARNMHFTPTLSKIGVIAAVVFVYATYRD